jgi:hypothetical protein
MGCYLSFRSGSTTIPVQVAPLHFLDFFFSSGFPPFDTRKATGIEFNIFMEFIMDRSIIGDSLVSMGWIHNSETNLWSNDKSDWLDLETALVYAIRFASSSPPIAGDRVQVLAGPFIDFEGIVESIDFDKKRVRVLVDIYGRTTPVQLQVQELMILK